MRYPMEVFWSDEDEGFIAIAPDLPGASAWGKTEAAATKELYSAIDLWIRAAKKMAIARKFVRTGAARLPVRGA